MPKHISKKKMQVDLDFKQARTCSMTFSHRQNFLTFTYRKFKYNEGPHLPLPPSTDWGFYEF